MLQNNPSPSVEVAGLTLRRQEFDVTTVQFDLVADVYDAAPGLLVKLRYSTDLFAAATVRRLLKHFEALLEGVCQDPDQPVGAVALDAEEAEQLAYAFNDDLG